MVKQDPLMDDKSTWSDDLGYLATLAWLINKAHEASMDVDQDVYDWFFILEQLQVEVEGQLYVKEKMDSIKKVDEMTVKVKKALAKIYTTYGDQIGNLSQTKAGDLRDVVFPYHRLLNRVIHKEQLRLRNFDDGGFSSAFARNQSRG